MRTEELSETRKSVLVRTLDGESARTIARDLDISEARVYQHLSRLRELGFLPPKNDAAA